ncbi:MAG: 50S ribosomal protein L31e [Desulfurococcales archaeon]|nr:50S ribosomal protein L31e [Desulfurococcales archaeon]
MSERKSSSKTLFTIPLSRVYWGRRSNRAKRAIKLIREFVKRQYKKAEKIIIDNSVNELVWSRGIEKPPRRIRVKVEYDEKEKVVKVFLPEKK